MKTFRPSELEWRYPLAPHRIGEYADAIDFNQCGGVTEPGHSQTGCVRRGPHRDWVDQRQWSAGDSSFATAEKVANCWARNARLEAGEDAVSVHEVSAVEPWRGMNSLEATVPALFAVPS